MVMDTVPPPSLAIQRDRLAYAAQERAMDLQRQWAARLVKAPPKPPSRPLSSRAWPHWALIALPWIVAILLDLWQEAAPVAWGRAFITGDGF